jgi:hypothetical protein
MSDRIDELAARLTRLERQNRIMKFATAGAVLACLAFTSVPGALSKTTSTKFPHGPKHTYSEEFDLVSPSGVLLASLQGGTGSTSPSLVFWDANEKPVVSVGIGASSNGNPPFVGVSTFDGNTYLAGNGVARAFWGQTAPNSSTSSPGFLGGSVNDGNGTGRIGLQTAADGTNGGAYFFDQNGVTRAGIGLASTGPGMFLNDATAEKTALTRYVVGVSLDTSGSFNDVVSEIFDDTGNAQANLFGIGDHSQSSLWLYNTGGTTEALEANQTTSTGGQIETFNSSGTETDHLP